MVRARHLAASLLLAVGIVLVFTGLTAALGFTGSGLLASVAAVAGLLYAGAIWFGGPAPAAAPGAVLMFDHRLDLMSGGSLLTLFPERVRGDLRGHCLAALAGERARVTVDGRAFQVLPVVDGEGEVLYGVLIESVAAPELRVG